MRRAWHTGHLFKEAAAQVATRGQSGGHGASEPVRNVEQHGPMSCRIIRMNIYIYVFIGLYWGIYGVYLWGIYEVTISCYIYAHMYVRILYGIHMSTHTTRTRVSFWLMSGSNISKHVKMIGHQKLAVQKISTNNSMILFGQLVHQFWPIEKTYWVSWCIFGVCWKSWVLWYPKISYAYK